MVLILASINRGVPYLLAYTGIGVSSVPYRKSREEVATTPPSEDVLQKYLRRTMVNGVLDYSIHHNIGFVINSGVLA